MKCPNTERQHEIWRKASNKYQHTKKGRKTTRQREREYRAKYQHLIFDLLGSKCSWCGITDLRVIQIDHVNGGGTAERKKPGQKSRWNYYRGIFGEISAGSKNYQLLCANCNWIKRWEKRECRERLE